MRKRILILCSALLAVLGGCEKLSDPETDYLSAEPIEGYEGSIAPSKQAEESGQPGVRKQDEAESYIATMNDEKLYGNETGGNTVDGEEQSIHPADDAKSGETPTDQSMEILVSVVGDVTLGNHHQQEYAYSFRQAYDEVKDPSYFFQNVSEYFGKDDMTLINLEGMLTTSDTRNGDRTYYIKGEPEYADILTAGSIEAVSMANNHRLDYGERATADTVELLKERNIAYGYDSVLGSMEVKGKKIGYVAVTKISPHRAVEDFIRQSIEQMKAEGADLVFVCCHWGVEGSYTVEQYQKTLAHSCIDWGADLVIGHHPHVLQGIEQYRDRLILYSLGNFCFGANRNPKDKDTMIVQVSFHFADDGSKECSARVIPCSVSSIPERNDFVPTPLEGEEGRRVLQKVMDLSTDFQLAIDEDGYIIP